MLALLAANSCLGIEDANLQHFYWFLCGSSHACSMPCRVQVNRSLFYGAAREKTRDLSDPQINVLAISSAPGPDKKTAQDTRLHTTLGKGRAKGTRADRVFRKPDAANRLSPQKARIE